ncbi:MAG: aspartate/glutamate racemase family protein [Candidatus Aureabacteria bacterium]|nr:aspartate/glutamate racemase family protein [Candidatus Auribacterota bacterium]
MKRIDYFFLSAMMIFLLIQGSISAQAGLRYEEYGPHRSRIDSLAPSSMIRRIFIIDSGMGAEQLKMLLEQQVSLRKGFQYELLVLGHSIGGKPKGEKRLLMEQLIMRSVQEFGADGSNVFCVACNTFTFLGAVPYIRSITGHRKMIIYTPVYVTLAALKGGQDDKIGVMGTDISIDPNNGNSYPHLLKKNHGYQNILTYNGQELIDAIQEQVSDEQLRPLVEKAAELFKRDGIQHLILGCTHYTRIYHWLQRLLPGIKIYDSNTLMANRFAQFLLDHDLAVPNALFADLPVYGAAGQREHAA